MKRRDFLHLAMAAAAASQARPLFAARPQSTGPAGANDRIRAAIVGCGNRGRAVMREWMEHADSTFVAACDVAKDRTDATVAELVKAGHKAEGFEDYRRILDRSDVDAILIGTPDHWHAPMVIEAIAAGKDVYLEKPVSNQIEPAVRMLRAARASNRVIQVGQQQRSWTHFMEAADRFHKQAVGSVIRHVVMAPPGGGAGGGGALQPLASEMPAEPIPAGFNWDLFQGPAERRPFLAARRGWRGWWAYGGGNLADWGVHLTDVMSWFMRAESQVPILTSASAQFVGARRDPERTPNTYAATWQFENFVATLSNAMMPGIENPQENYGNWFFGNQGTMLVNRLGWEIFPSGGGGGRGGGRGAGAAAPQAVTPESPDARERFRDPQGRSEARGTEFAFATRRHVRNFLDAVKSRGATNCDMEAGFYAALPCLLANVAILEERTIRWDVEKLAVV